MANTSKICGLRPVSPLRRVNVYSASTGGQFFMYQPVDADANGRAVVATASNATLILGSIVGLLNDAYGPPDNAYSGYIPANPASINSAGVVYLLVADHPEQEFVIEEETGGGTQLTATNIGNAAPFTYIATTGNTSTGISNACLDASGVGTTTDLTLRLIKKWDKPDNDYGAYCKWIVKINRHRLSPMNLVAGNLI